MFSALAHADHPIAAPVGDDAVGRLLARAVRRGDERLLDLGCGEAEWLARALTAHPAVVAEGVDVSRAALGRAAERAAAAGFGDRLVLHEADATGFRPDRAFDVVVSVGATHVFGGLLPTLGAAGRLLAPGGRVLVGDCYWRTAPSRAAREMLGEHHDLATTMDEVGAAGWVPVYGHVSTRHELDDYEWSWTGSLTAWALDHPDDPEAGAALATADRHRAGWLRGYRDSFGFVTMLLARAPGATE